MSHPDRIFLIRAFGSIVRVDLTIRNLAVDEIDSDTDKYGNIG